MTKAEKRKIFMDIRDMCRKSTNEDVSGKVYDALEKAGEIDYDYADHLKDKDGYDMASNADNLTFNECCTALTFLLRADRWSEGTFNDYLKNGLVYKLLSRAVEVM